MKTLKQLKELRVTSFITEMPQNAQFTIIGRGGVDVPIFSKPCETGNGPDGCKSMRCR